MRMEKNFVELFVCFSWTLIFFKI